MPEIPQLDGVTHRFVDLPDVRLHVAEAGAGEPLLLLHGFPQHWWMWRGVIPGLARRYRVLVPDLRGFGWSDAPPGDYGKQQLVDDVVALLDALELDRVRLAGHDWGGLVGFLLCLQQPARVERYLALNTAHPFLTVDARLLAMLWRFWYQLAIGAPVVGARLLRDSRRRFGQVLVRWLTVDPNAWAQREVDLFLGQFRDPARARAGSALYRTFSTREMLPFLRGDFGAGRLTTPTLMFHGDSDPVLRPTFLRGFEAHADDMRVELVRDVGHFIVDEQPELVLERALRFFGAPAGGAPDR